MREELRAASLKIFTLRYAEVAGQEAAGMLLGGADVDPQALAQETGWVSVEAARRVLIALQEEQGSEALKSAAPLVSHPEALGVWVRLVREAKDPLDAYRYLAAHSAELTRVGEYSVEELPPNGLVRVVRVTHRPRPEEAVETDDLFTRMRAVQLAGLTTLFGLPPAEVQIVESVAQGAEACVYDVTIRLPDVDRRFPAILAAGGAVVGAAAVAPFGGGIAGGISGVLLGGAAFVVARQRALRTAQERDRAAERVRIAALERGLELRGDAPIATQGDLVGTVLGGKYRIGKRIGSGGIGVVHAAKHVSLGTQVAVKVLRGAAAKDGAEIARLRREAQVASAIDHPNVVKVVDLDQLPDGSIYVVMELLRGRSLAEKLHRDGPLGPGYAIHVFRQVCNALAAAHDLGVVHRDLKPGNVFLCDDGESAKVLDFGMSKLGPGASAAAEKLTQDGYTLGTPEYMAPEQCIGAAVEPRTDLYELGVLVYEAVTGDLPIKSTNRRDLLDLHQRQVPPPMRQRRPDLPIPKELDDAIAICLKKRIHDRPEDARELERMLAAVPLEGVPYHYAKNMGRHARRIPATTPEIEARPTEKARTSRQ